MTRSKAIAATSQDVRITRATAPALASKAKTSGTATDNPIGKRKRDVLVEVTGVANNAGNKGSGTVKGKAKAGGIGGGVGSKLMPASKSVRESLRSMAGPIARGTHRAGNIRTISTQATDKILKNAASKETVATIDQCPPPSTHPPLTSDDVEVGRIFKKRHTQSPVAIRGVQDDSRADEDKIAAELIDIEEESIGKPKLWEDLDKGDWDDPTMVSEYVADVCVYLKEIEVCRVSGLPQSIID